jgi:hypothetical protein
MFEEGQEPVENGESKIWAPKRRPPGKPINKGQFL